MGIWWGFFNVFHINTVFAAYLTSGVLTCIHNYRIKGCPKPPFQSLLNPQGVKFLLRWLIQTMRYLHRAQRKVWNSVMDVWNRSRVTSPPSAPLLENTALIDNPHAKHLLHPRKGKISQWNRVEKTAVWLSCLWILPTSSFQGFSSQQPVIPTFRTLIYMIF